MCQQSPRHQKIHTTASTATAVMPTVEAMHIDQLIPRRDRSKEAVATHQGDADACC